MGGGEVAFFGGFLVLWAVLIVVSLAGYVFGIWALVEVLRYREDEFEAVGKNRTTWLVLLIVGLAVCQPLGAVAGVLFLWRHRPELQAWREAHPVPPLSPWVGPSGRGPGYGPAPPPGYGPAPGYGPPRSQAPPSGYGPPPGVPPPEPPAPGVPPPEPPAPGDADDAPR
jgi:hypothetical protein